MKRLFISELDTLLGRKICDLFASTKEYEITGTVRNDEKAYLLGLKPLPLHVTSITPSYRTGNVAFKMAVLQSDAIICLARDDIIEAEAACKMLRNEHYEVEKTLVVVSSIMTWSNTIASRKAQEKADRDADKAARIADGEDVDDDPVPEEEDEPIVLLESEYHGRVPHSKYQHWKDLEILVKQSDSATLHTHVIFAGLQYGLGEEAFTEAFLAAWHQQHVPQYTNGTNVVPMIHVQDLAQVVFKVASADEISDQRYILAVDRANSTLGSVFQTIATKMGNGLTVSFDGEVQGTLPYGDFFSVDMRMEPSSVFDIHPEDEWFAPNGFVASFDRVAKEFRDSHQLSPIRAMLLGPPMAGKTTLGKQIAAFYRVPLLSASSLIKDYEGHLVQLENSLKKHRDDRKKVRKQQEFALLEEEARETKEAAQSLKETKKGEDEESDADEEDKASKDDVSEIGFNNSGYHLLPDISEGGKGDADEEEDEDAKGGAQRNVAVSAEDEDEEDDPEDEFAAQMVEQIQRAKEILSLKIREGLKPRVEGDEEDDGVDEDGNPIPKPLPAGVRLRFVDEALAAMGKWRLRQKDCLNQGYILDGFPQNVRQAQTMFHSEEVTLPTLEEVKERELEPLPPMDLNEATSQVDQSLLPDVCIHLYSDENLLLSRVDDNNPHTSMTSFVKRLRLYNSNHDPKRLSDRSLLTWAKSTTTEEIEASSENGFIPVIKSRQMFYVELAAGSLVSEEGLKAGIGFLKATLGERHYILPTAPELKKDACEREYKAELHSFQSQRAEEKRIEEERLIAEKQHREMAVHERRYRSIAEERVAARSINEMAMETYLAQFILQPVAKGVERVVEMRPEDPIKALADFLFEYEPRKQL